MVTHGAWCVYFARLQDHPNVKMTRENGLSNCFDYHADMPDVAATWLADYSNKWHHNGNINHLQKLAKSASIEAMWLKENKLPSNSPQYDAAYKEWLRKYHARDFSEWDPYNNAKSTMHFLTKCKVWEEFRIWGENYVKFSELPHEPNVTVAGVPLYLE
jgi:hypothetical protein